MTAHRFAAIVLAPATFWLAVSLWHHVRARHYRGHDFGLHADALASRDRSLLYAVVSALSGIVTMLVLFAVSEP